MFDLIFIAFLVFSIFGFLEGFSTILQEPSWILLAILSVFLTNLLFSIVKNNVTKIQITSGSFVDKISSNKNVKYLTLVALWILSGSNFIYAFSTNLSRGRNGLEFLEAVILCFIAFTILQHKRK